MLPKTAEARTRGLLLPRRKRRSGRNGRGADFVLIKDCQREQTHSETSHLETLETDSLNTEHAHTEAVVYIEAVPSKRPNFIERQQQRENSVVRWCRETVRWFFESFLVVALVASAIHAS